MQRLYNRLSTIVEDLKDLEHDEKLEFLEQTQILIEKQRVFHTRLSLVARTDDNIREIVDNMDKLSKVLCGESMSKVLESMYDKICLYMNTLTPPK
jgi:hypothetical protein